VASFNVWFSADGCRARVSEAPNQNPAFGKLSEIKYYRFIKPSDKLPRPFDKNTLCETVANNLLILIKQIIIFN